MKIKKEKIKKVKKKKSIKKKIKLEDYKSYLDLMQLEKIALIK